MLEQIQPEIINRFTLGKKQRYDIESFLSIDLRNALAKARGNKTSYERDRITADMVDEKIALQLRSDGDKPENWGKIIKYVTQEVGDLNPDMDIKIQDEIKDCCNKKCWGCSNDGGLYVKSPQEIIFERKELTLSKSPYLAYSFPHFKKVLYTLKNRK